MKTIRALREYLQTEKLPGEAGWESMKPESRSRYSDLKKDIASYKQASVLILLFESEGKLFFPVIRRVDDGSPHSGQMGLPGGGIDKGETPKEAALRETFEEIGIQEEKIKILFKLTPLSIPVSGYLVHPFVGYIGYEPTWKLDHLEIEKIYIMDASKLEDTSMRKKEMRTFEKRDYEIPFFDLEGNKIWGATAMILSEFSEILKK